MYDESIVLAVPFLEFANKFGIIKLINLFFSYSTRGLPFSEEDDCIGRGFERFWRFETGKILDK
jgi:hypothetical protein